VTGTDKVIGWSTAAAVIGVAVVAAVVSYEHAYALVHAHGETGWMARLIPLTVDGLTQTSPGDDWPHRTCLKLRASH
jgi:hypothetical protein